MAVTCEKCKRQFRITADTSYYYGPADASDTTCNPFFEYILLCSACFEGSKQQRTLRESGLEND